MSDVQTFEYKFGLLVDCATNQQVRGHEFMVAWNDYAALKAENKRLKKALSEQIDRDISGIFPAERALAGRAGGVKVKALEWQHGYASTMFGGGYLVTYYAGMKEPAKLETRGWYDGAGVGYYESVDAAKAAAQADYERRILSALATEPAAPEGRQEAVRIGDAVLDWMVKFDLLDAGNEYCASDVLAVLNDLTPSTRPAEQAATEDDVAARLWKAEAEDVGAPASIADNRTRAAFDNQSDDLKARWRKFAKAAMEARDA